MRFGSGGKSTPKNRIITKKKRHKMNTELNQKSACSKTLLPAVSVVVKKGKCHNCKHSSSAFKIAGKTHRQCLHARFDEGFKNYSISPWETLQEWHSTCEFHEFKDSVVK